MASKGGGYLISLSFTLAGWVNSDSPFPVWEATGVFGAKSKKLPARETRSRKVIRDDER